MKSGAAGSLARESTRAARAKPAIVLGTMRSVADALRAEDRARMRAMTASDRLASALALGRLGLETFRQARALPLEAAEATRRLERRQQVARRSSACLRALIG
jgi:hypothetical protein